MKYIVYFDSGTTNTRIYLLNERLEQLDCVKKRIGSRDSAIAGTNAPLIEGLYALYSELLARHGLQDDEIAQIYASGMITSPYGLREVPHLLLPFTLEEYAHSFAACYEGTRFHREIILIPGAKTVENDISAVNNVRGEEIEAVGLMENLPSLERGESAALVLPGSHTNIVQVEPGRLLSLLSTFTGELYEALSKDTILAPVLTTRVDALDPEMVRLGISNLQTYGFNRALYIAHAMRIFSEGTPAQRFSYAEGVLFGDVGTALCHTCETRWHGCRTALIAAPPFLANLYTMILEYVGFNGRIQTIPLKAESSFALKGFKKLMTFHH